MMNLILGDSKDKLKELESNSEELHRKAVGIELNEDFYNNIKEQIK